MNPHLIELQSKLQRNTAVMDLLPQIEEQLKKIKRIIRRSVITMALSSVLVVWSLYNEIDALFHGENIGVFALFFILGCFQIILGHESLELLRNARKTRQGLEDLRSKILARLRSFITEGK